MQRRLDEYEKQGAEATRQMQQAARAVAIENSRLRMLLARRGVTPDEVDKFLAMFETGIPSDDETTSPLGSMPAASASTGHYTHRANAAATTTATTTHSTNPSTYQHHNQYQGDDGGIDRLAVLADASIGDQCCGNSGPTCVTTPSESTVAAQSPPSAGPSTMPGTPVSGPHGSQYHGHGHVHGHHNHHHHQNHYVTPQKAPGSDSPLVMSCNTAAQIIAEMQGGAPHNKHAVRASLGCEDDECECFVKNTLLFQIMEKNAT